MDMLDKVPGTSSSSSQHHIMKMGPDSVPGMACILDSSSISADNTRPKNGLQKHFVQRSRSEACFKIDRDLQVKSANDMSNMCLVHSLSDLNLNINGMDLAGVNSSGFSEDPTSEFAGRRDVSKPQTLQERSIVSRRGSIRGFKNRVSAGIATFRQAEQGVQQVRMLTASLSH